MAALSHIPGAPPRIRRTRNRAEDSVQAAVVEYLRLVLPASRYRVFSIPNGSGKLSVQAGRRLKAMGLMPGVADIEILGRDGLAYFIEVKTDEGRPSQVQRDFQKWCEVNNVPYAFVRSVDDAQRCVREWGLG